MVSELDPKARAAAITDFDSLQSAKPLPLQPGEPGGTEVARRNDSATGDLAFITKNNQIDQQYQLPGGGQNSRGTWVRRWEPIYIPNNICACVLKLDLVIG